MRTILLSSVAGAALLAGDGLAATPMETSPGQGQGIIVAMGKEGKLQPRKPGASFKSGGLLHPLI
ncbi:MAG: hypothetical protein USCAAHI_02163 [Beijerinckiaceae bacterium]|nr:MAG: hypothetical protein USCAAHI_02163 [Beijerinckiaceae bacterium]